MRDCAAHNRIYRVVWNRARGVWMVVGEIAKGLGKGNGRRKHSLRGLLLLIPLSLISPLAVAAPTGGQVTAGAGSISQSGSTTTIHQSSQNLSLSWKTFNVAANETVNFNQPNSSAVAVNRISDPNGSTIMGHINANGNIYLINPNGIVFGATAQVNVGGLVASTLDIGDGSLGNSNRTFAGTGTGAIVNEGTINASHYVALLGDSVTNSGVITAQMGTVAMGAGDNVSLSFSGNNLVKLQVNQSVVNSLVANHGLIQADGGMVIMNAGARDSLLASVVNNDGIVEAQTVQNHNGTITLMGGMVSGTVNVGGTLDASAPNGGNGGHIETSAAQVQIASGAKVTAASASGLAGSWLIDPNDYTINSTNATTFDNTLNGGTPVTISSSSGTVTNGTGSINIDAAMSWSKSLLTLSAGNNININAVMSASGTAALTMTPAGTNAAGSVDVGMNSSGFTGRVDYTASGALTIGGKTYTVINSISGLQNINTTGLSGYYALGTNLNDSNAAFTPIGSSATHFSGVFDGLGHTISNLYDNSPTLADRGLFGTNAGVIRNVGLASPSISAKFAAGALVGFNASGGTISHAFATSVAVSVTGDSAGGLVGDNSGSINHAFATGAVTGTGATYGTSSTMGGLVGGNNGSVSDSWSSASVNAQGNTVSVGGLVGYNNPLGATLSNSFYDIGSVQVNGSTGYLSAGGIYDAQYQAWIGNGMALSPSSYFTASGGYNLISSVQGLKDMLGFAEDGTAKFRLSANLDLSTNAGFYVPYFAGTFDGSNHTISNLNISPGMRYLGMFGQLKGGAINNLGLVKASVTGLSNVGGLVGTMYGGSLSNDYVDATSTVSATSGGTVGGLVGQADAPSGSVTISQSHASATVSATGTGSNHNVGGLVGEIGGNGTVTISDSYATGAVSGSTYVGGLVGEIATTGHSISNSYATGNVTGSGGYVGGLVGNTYGTPISNSYATGAVSGSNAVGGLVGDAYYGGSITDSYATGKVTATASGGYGGGLVGFEYGSTSHPFATYSNDFYDSSVNSGLNGIGGSTYYGGTPSTNTTSTVAANAAGHVYGMSSTNMQKSSNFTNATTANGNSNPGWDLTNTWKVYDGHTDPLLRAFLTPLTVTANNVSTIYNGSTYSGGYSVSYAGFKSGDNASVLGGTLSYSGSATTNSNVGTNYVITPGGYYSGQQGYLISYASGTLKITPKTVTLSASKTYDGTTGLSGTQVSIGTGISGQTLSFSNATAHGANVGSNSSNYINNGIVLKSNTGGLASNYQLPTLNHTNAPVSIIAKTVTLSASKTYDGTTGLTGTDVTIGTGISGQALTYTGAAAHGANHGSNSTNYISGITLANGTGGTASNYQLPTTLDHSTAPVTIGQKALTESGLSVPSYKTYDGNTTATVGGTVTLQAAEAAGAGSNNDGKPYSVDSVSLTGTATGTYNTADVATANSVAYGGLSLTGSGSSNYTLTMQANAAATIHAAPLTATITAANKTYDGTTSATPTFTITGGLVGTQTVTATGTASFSNRNAGTGKTVTAQTVTLSNGANGGLASNYSLAVGETTTATIYQKALTESGLSLASASKGYDGTTSATVSGTAALPTAEATGVGTNNDGKPYSVDSVSLTGTATGTYNSANVATASSVAYGGLSLAGSGYANYKLTMQGNAAATITPVGLTATANNATKTYDGSAYSGGNGVSYSGFVGGENSSVLGGTLAYGGNSQGASAIGTYVIVPSGLTSGNYSLSFVNGALSIVAQSSSSGASSGGGDGGSDAYILSVLNPSPGGSQPQLGGGNGPSSGRGPGRHKHKGGSPFNGPHAPGSGTTEPIGNGSLNVSDDGVHNPPHSLFSE